MKDAPFVDVTQHLPEITAKVLIISTILTLLLAVSNAYLALKIGILTSASIPAAILAMGILRCFKQSNILENNLIQTTASAGQAVAGGVVYSAPALVITHFWLHFPYWQTVCLSLLGGLLGVFFSIPLRRMLVEQPILRFPEGRAVAEVLKAGNEHWAGIRHLLFGGGVGALLEFAQSGLHLLVSQMQCWFTSGGVLWGFAMGFSPTMLGAGYLIGIQIGLGLLLGGGVAWLIGVPIASVLLPYDPSVEPMQAVMQLWDSKLRYIGLGAMFLAGLYTLLTLVKPLILSFRAVPMRFRNLLDKSSWQEIPSQQRDIPLPWVLLAIVGLLCALFYFFYREFPWAGLSLSPTITLLVLVLFYICLIGFVLVMLCGYFSGLVGVTATPGTSILIASVLPIALCLPSLLHWHGVQTDSHVLLSGIALVIFVGTTIMSAAAIGIDNIQDLKVGHILGATPWKQQVMLIFGVVLASLVIPPVMQLLFDVYGIGDVRPHLGMDPSQTLAAPPAAMMAAVTQAIFQHTLPLSMLGIGALMVIGLLVINVGLRRFGLQVSVISFALGMYLPLSSSLPLFLGSWLSYLVNNRLQQRTAIVESARAAHQQRGILLACGLVAGAALMAVCLAVPFALTRNPNVLRMVPVEWSSLPHGLTLCCLVGLGIYVFRTVLKVR